MSSQTLPQYLNYKTPAVVIQFDDGLASLYTEAFAYMNALGMKGTGYIISPPFQNVSDAQLIEMDAAGWDMANHTTSNDLLTGMNEADQETAINGQKGVLDGLGLTRASSHVAYPSGAWNADTLTAMTNLSMLTGRTTVESRENFRYMTTNPFLIPSTVYRSDANTVAGTKAKIDACDCDAAVLFLYFHAIVESGATGNETNRAEFRAIIDYIYSKHMIALTISQVYALMSGSISYTNYWN